MSNLWHWILEKMGITAKEETTTDKHDVHKHEHKNRHTEEGPKSRGHELTHEGAALAAKHLGVDEDIARYGVEVGRHMYQKGKKEQSRSGARTASSKHASAASHGKEHPPTSNVGHHDTKHAHGHEALTSHDTSHSLGHDHPSSAHHTAGSPVPNSHDSTHGHGHGHDRRHGRVEPHSWEHDHPSAYPERNTHHKYGISRKPLPASSHITQLEPKARVTKTTPRRGRR